MKSRNAALLLALVWSAGALVTSFRYVLCSHGCGRAHLVAELQEPARGLTCHHACTPARSSAAGPVSQLHDAGGPGCPCIDLPVGLPPQPIAAAFAPAEAPSIPTGLAPAALAASTAMGCRLYADDRAARGSPSCALPLRL